MVDSTNFVSKKSAAQRGLKLSTEDYSVFERRDWLREMICNQYTKVEVTPPANHTLFNETTIYDWNQLRLSVIRSHGITIERQRGEPHFVTQDHYLAVILLSGRYMLEQNGREVFLEPGDMTIYDATLPHRIYCPSNFSKVLISIPRQIMRDRMAGVEHCTARNVLGKVGVGSVTAGFVSNVVDSIATIDDDSFLALSEHALDLVTLSLVSARPQNYHLSRVRSVSLMRVKSFVEAHLADAALDVSKVAGAAGLSPRYINQLFQDENTSLMRYVWDRRLEHCHNDLSSMRYQGKRISEIAFRWGFNDLSHFSRVFKRKFTVTASEISQTKL